MAARWIAREIDRSMIIACDPQMCTALTNYGWPPSNLLPLSPTAPDPFQVEIIVATQAMRNQFGGRLSSEFAPLVLAGFGKGTTSIQVRVVASHGATAYLSKLARDVTDRRQLGKALIGNTAITLSATAKGELAAGRVDRRLLLSLPPLASIHPIHIVAFFDQPPGADLRVPLTGVELATTSPASGMTNRAYRQWLVSFLHTQRTPWRALSVTEVAKNGVPMVFVRYSRPSPLVLPG